MAVSRPRSIPASKYRFGVPLIGITNGVNTVFTTPEPFRQTVPTAAVQLYLNGQRLRLTADFGVSESAPGSGFNTITMTFPLLAGETLWADFFAV